MDFLSGMHSLVSGIDPSIGVQLSNVSTYVSNSDFSSESFMAYTSSHPSNHLHNIQARQGASLPSRNGLMRISMFRRNHRHFELEAALSKGGGYNVRIMRKGSVGHIFGGDENGAHTRILISLWIGK
jgi:hypothetical protein